MSSTIFYRFKSQKANSRIAFDGTGITVFDLKKEIIAENKLGDGTNFELRIYNSDSMEEYADDTVVVPRSTSVVARRSPPSKNGKSNATRYVTGKPKITRITLNTNNHNNTASQQPSNEDTQALSESDRINLMFAKQQDQWQETQHAMSSVTPVYNKQTNTATTAGQDDAPPPGYMCYRCGSKDHWIKNCPTNNDPNWEGKRVKRTTGIPKTYLQTVEDPQNDPSKTYMMNEEGKFVVQVADSKTWETFKKKVSKTQQLVEDLKDEVDKEFLDPYTAKIMEDPVTTPCCSKTFSKISIEDRLLETDFVCPSCSTEDIFLDSLVPNTALNEKIEKYLDGEFEKRGIKRNQANNEEKENASNKRQNIGTDATPSLPGAPAFGLPLAPQFGAEQK